MKQVHIKKSRFSSYSHLYYIEKEDDNENPYDRKREIAPSAILGYLLQVPVVYLKRTH